MFDSFREEKSLLTYRVVASSPTFRAPVFPVLLEINVTPLVSVDCLLSGQKCSFGELFVQSEQSWEVCLALCLALRIMGELPPLSNST